MLNRYLAAQLERPSGLLGKVLISRFLDSANGEINDSTLELLDVQPDDHVLEVGFGGGYLLRHAVEQVTSGHVAGVDFSPEMVARLSRRLRRHITAGSVSLTCASADHLPYDAARFSKACAVNTVYFWQDCRMPLRELHRVLRPHGTVVVSFSTPATLEGVLWARRDFLHYGQDEVRTLLQDIGFTGVEAVAGMGRAGEYICITGVKASSAVV